MTSLIMTSLFIMTSLLIVTSPIMTSLLIIHYIIIRLSVRNLPVNINEKKLRVLFKSHGGDNAFIKQVISWYNI